MCDGKEIESTETDDTHDRYLTGSPFLSFDLLIFALFLVARLGQG